MKLAVITDDGKTISQHFGRALSYMVLTIEDGKITEREMRSKLGQTSFREKNNTNIMTKDMALTPFPIIGTPQMADAISDCQAILCAVWVWVPIKACSS